MSGTPRRSACVVLVLTLLSAGGALATPAGLAGAGETRPLPVAPDPGFEALRGRHLVVGIKEAPPFTFKRPDGTWSGISIDLWRHIAAELKLTYDLEEHELPALVEGVRDGRLDVAVAALTVTPERERLFDFTHPFYTSGLGIAVLADSKEGWEVTLDRVFSLRFLQVVAGLAGLLFLVGLFVWLFERRRNPEQFGGGSGLVGAFWWSAVTMTTVGYGDKAPSTAGGRLVAIVWMFTSVIIISSFTAAIASALTVSRLELPVQGPEDLSKVSVATVGASTSEDYLRKKHLRYRAFATPREAFDAMAQGKTDAVLYDAPILRYLAKNEQEREARALSVVFERQDYAYALAAGSPLREPMNQILLDRIGSSWWKDVLYLYMGE